MMVILRMLLLCLLTSSGAEEETIRFELEHIVDGSSSWSPRGSILMKPNSPRSKMAVVETPVSLKKEEAGALWSLCFEQKGYYRVRARREGSTVTSSTSIPACSLFIVRFRESLELQLTAKADLLSLSYRNLPSSVVSLANVPKPENIDFETTASVALDVVGQIIPVQIAAKALPGLLPDDILEEGATIGEDGQAQPPPKKSFIQQYWHIIIPIALIFLTAKGDPGPDPAAAKAPPAAK